MKGYVEKCKQEQKEFNEQRLKEIIDFEMVLNKEIIQEIKKLVKTYNYTCYYTDKHVDFMDDLEVILDKYKEKK